MSTVYQAWNEAMNTVSGIAKKDRNDQQRFNFRGIDAVMNAVGPALRKHLLVVVPTAKTVDAETYTTAKGTSMRNITVLMEYTVFGPDGDSFTGSAFGEASDAGDKAVSKAQSVAYRTFLLQSMTMPTDERDPDADSHERAPRQQKSAAVVDDSGAHQARLELAEALNSLGVPLKDATKRFAEVNAGADLRSTADEAAIRKLLAEYRSEGVKVA